MVSRVYVEKKPEFDVESKQLEAELRTLLGIEGLESLRTIRRYDVEGIDDELFEQCVPTVFSEPQVDMAHRRLPTLTDDSVLFAVEYLPGQFDQRADSASECIQFVSCGERPEVRSATLYLLEGNLSDDDIAAIKHYVINPVEAREASLDEVETLKTEYPEPADVEVIEHFIDYDDEVLEIFIRERGLAMDLADIKVFQDYFANVEHRDPTITEVKMVDTYWSDHCRHTTFGTELTDIEIDDEIVQAAFDAYLDMRHELGRDEKPVCLMDMGTIGAKSLRRARASLRASTRARRSTPVPSRSRSMSTARTRTGCSSSKTRRTTTPPRSSPLVVRQPASAAAFATRCLVAPTCTRLCA